VQTLDKSLVITMTIIAFAFAYATQANAITELEEAAPWIVVSTDGYKDMEDTMNVPQPSPPKIETEIPLQPPVLLIFPEALPCHPVNLWLEKIQDEYAMLPFAQGRAVVRNATTGAFDRPEMLMMVNPLTKKFMLLGLWDNGYACILASGENFKGLLNP